MNFVDTAFLDADIILLIIDISDDEANQEMIGRVQQTESTVIIVLNKIDLSAEDEVKKQMDHWQKTVPGAHIIPVSALRNFNVESVFLRIIEFLPESPPFYPKDTLTDKSERFFASEIVREKILLNFKQEIPYSTEVVIDPYQETPGLVRIIAFIFVSRESQKAIMLGHGGKAIKRLGTDARKDLEKFTGKKVYLELSIKVKKDWRNNEQELKRFGYNN